MPGRQIVAYLSGSDNESSYTSFAHIDAEGHVRVWKKHSSNASLAEAVKVLVGDPQAAAMAYALQSGNCYVCGRTLTTPESLTRGCGSICHSHAYDI